MTSLRDFLATDLLASADIELKRRRSLERLSEHLSTDTPDLWLRSLSRFASVPPWSYWDAELLRSALEILEISTDRTVSALEAWAGRIGVGFENLLRPAPTSYYEESLTDDKPQDLLRLATEFHPEYLRCAEHIFTNFLTLYWAILRKGAVKAKFDIAGALTIIQNKGCDFLLSGYDEKVRNAIAHGEVVFTGTGIQYGSPEAHYKLTSSEFLSKLDALWRTMNALAIALLLFLARNRHLFVKLPRPILPSSIIMFLAAAGVERPGLTVTGIVESDVPSIGKQLHITIRTIFRAPEAVLLETAQLAFHLLENGASAYSRYLINIDHGKPIPSFVRISVEHLARLLQDQAPFERWGEIFQEQPLLWYQEGKFVRQLKVWKLLFGSHLKLLWENIQNDWRKTGLLRGGGRFRIRKIENASVAGIPRIWVTAVLQHPEDADNQEVVRQVIHAIVNMVSRTWINKYPSDFKRRLRWPGHPKYIWVWLYKIDGTYRWLRGGGWAGGNIVAAAEKVRDSRRSPIFVRNPEEIWKGMRLRYSMDVQVAAEAIDELATIIGGRVKDNGR